MKIFFTLILFLTVSSNILLSDDFFIKYKVNNKIITNYDIEKEERYLLTLNPSLKKIDVNQRKNLATKSIIREKIKLIELSKYYDLEINENEDILADIINNLFIKNGLKNEQQIKKYLNDSNLEYEWVLQKIKIETYWNTLIMQKYGNQVKIDTNKIKEELQDQLKNIRKDRKLLLSEILVQFDNKKNIESEKQKILKSIKDIGFENTASMLSISDSAKTGGKIGWINEKTLSKQIFEKLKNLKKDEISSFIKLNNNYLIIKIVDVEEIKKKFNFEKILQKRISLKKNQQLEIFSGIYFEKIKQNTIIDEK